MDIIIHGKPLDASQKFSDGIDTSLAQNIVDEFFKSIDIKVPEAMVVDARYWKGAWSSVYTLYLGKRVKDMNGRETYFAISLILPQKYCCIVSDVYDLLENIVRDNVLDTYLNQKFEYKVKSFEDEAAFKTLCDNLQSKYNNLEKEFDKTFKQVELNNETYYNIDDCDSRAFFHLLKNKGRVIVTEEEEAKDARIATLSEQKTTLAQEKQRVEEELTTEKGTNAQLNNTIRQMEETAQSARNNAKGRKELFEALKAQKQRADAQLKQAHADLDNLRQKIKNVASIIEEPKEKPEEQTIEESAEQLSSRWLKTDNLLRFLPVANTLLIVIGLICLCVNMKSHIDKETVLQDAKNAMAQVEALKGQLEQERNEMDSLRTENKKLSKLVNTNIVETKKKANNNKSKTNAKQ